MYELLPFILTPERAEIVSDILRRIAQTPTIFSEEIGCADSCIEAKNLPEMCEECLGRVRKVSAVLGAMDTVAWEVWQEEDLSGLIFFTDVSEIDALGHYVFFDNDLASKTDVIREAMSEMFERCRRLTVEIPVPFVALANHAYRRLEFGGRFSYTLKGERHLRVEGVKEKAARWRGEDVDVLVMGRVRGA